MCFLLLLPDDAPLTITMEFESQKDDIDPAMYRTAYMFINQLACLMIRLRDVVSDSSTAPDCLVREETN